MNSLLKTVFFLQLIFIFFGCKNSSISSVTPDTIHADCTDLFKRKGDAMGMAKPMCDSMKAACEKDLNSKECLKAQRMIKTG